MIRTAGGTVAFLALSVMSLARGEPRFNETPLRGLHGYSIQIILAHPARAREVGVDTRQMKTTLEKRLKEAELFAGPCCGDPLAGTLHVELQLMGPEAGIYGWYMVLEVQQSARLDRDPESGIVIAVPWQVAVSGIAPKAQIRDAVYDGFDGLISSLLKAHKRGGPASR